MADSADEIARLREEIARSKDGPYIYKIVVVMLRKGGLSSRHIANGLGESVRTVERWVATYEAKGLAGLREAPKGRPPRLNPSQSSQIAEMLRQAAIAGERWTGRKLVLWIERQLTVSVSKRKAQRLLRRYRKPC